MVWYDTYYAFGWDVLIVVSLSHIQGSEVNFK